MPVPLSYREVGEGPALIVLHGLFGSGTNWRSIARRLGHRAKVFLVDLRNHGGSPHASTMSYAEMASDIDAFMQGQGLTHATFLGHSMGGKVAMLMALESPSRVDRLIAVDIAPVQYQRDYAELIGALRSVDFDRVTRKADADAQLQDAIPDARVRMFLLQNLTTSSDGYQWRLALDAIERCMPTLLGFPELKPSLHYHGPALFVRGAQSEYVSQAHTPTIRARFPAAQIKSIQGAGHWIHADQRHRFLETVDDFLGQ